MTGSWEAMLADEHARGLHGDGCTCEKAPKPSPLLIPNPRNGGDDE